MINDLNFTSSSFDTENTMLNVGGNTYVDGGLLTSGNVVSKLNLVRDITATTYNVEASALVNGYFTMGTLGDNVTFNLPQAYSIVSAIPNCVVGSSFVFTINNVQNGGAYSVNLVDNGTLSFLSCQTTSIQQNEIIPYICVVTNIGVEAEEVKVLQGTSFPLVIT